ncbi:MAG: hypothetical protein FJW61_07620 [Actinobacteria bacterium]|nr:hypothetical protein [Actinomycetota bacterium]
MDIEKNVKKQARSLTITSLTTGILALVPIGTGLFLGPAAIICGFLDLCMSKGGEHNTRSIRVDVSGIILGFIGLLGTFAVIVYGIVVIINRYGIESWL